ncbi:C-C chemokine receptor type 1-like [Octodon degus]|uniref:C-C chemokine receptor type 1-like n=1 Tax=Octodon degus TaxID=10160 RepID=A0A6P3FJ69_OCTDE|nr:C-C chemokine receptor type 1-like [Octodon degus]
MEIPMATEDYSLTTEYDYGALTLCHSVVVRAFTSQALPPLYSLVFLIGVVGNVLVVLVLMKYKRLQSMTTIYLLNLALSDLLSLFTLPFRINYQVKESWIFGNGMCKLLSGLYYVGLYSEIFFIVLLTIDRYLAIVHTVFALRARTVTLGIITSVVTWALAFLASVPELYFSKTQWVITQYSCDLYYPYDSHEAWRYFQALKLNLLGFILPLLVMVFCYASILNVLLHRPNQEKAKAVRLIFIIMIIFFLFWTPHNLAVFVSAFQEHMFTKSCEQYQQLTLALRITEVIANTHCCINPVIYVFVGHRFRKDLRQLFQRQVAVCLGTCQPFFSRPQLEGVSSVSVSTGEQVPSDML